MTGDALRLLAAAHAAVIAAQEAAADGDLEATRELLGPAEDNLARARRQLGRERPA